jgi:hypothetical protein
MTEITALRELFADPCGKAEGVTWEYAGYQLTKVETPGLSPAHSEVAVYNRDGKKVESFTVDAFDDFQAFRGRLDALIAYDPDDMSDWLNRERPDAGDA